MTPDSKAIGLQQMMDARERRFFTRRSLLSSSDEGLVLLQICINIPGEKKNSPMIRDIFREALKSITETAPARLRMTDIHEDWVTGPEGFLLFAMEGKELKRLCYTREEEHPLGRLWDLDVFLPDGTQISRRDLSLPPRSCFLCGGNAHECARSRTHSVSELKAYINNLYMDYKA